MKMNYDSKFKGRGKRKCKVCGSSRALIRSFKLTVCRRCFREVGNDIGFEKYS